MIATVNDGTEQRQAETSYMDYEQNSAELTITESTITSPVKAIRAFCLECCGDSPTEVKYCTSARCPLKPFRFGRNPFHTRSLTEEQRAASIERLRKAREDLANSKV